MLSKSDSLWWWLVALAAQGDSEDKDVTIPITPKPTPKPEPTKPNLTNMQSLKKSLGDKKTFYPTLIVLATCTMSVICLIYWYNLLFPSAVSTVSGNLPPSSAIFNIPISQAADLVLPLMAVILVGAVVMYFVIKHNKASILSYLFVCLMFMMFVSVSIVAAQNVLLFVFSIILPIVTLFVYIRKPISYLYTYSAVIFSAWYGSFIVTLIQSNLAIILLLSFLVCYDLFAVFVGPIKQMASKFKGTKFEKSSLRFMMIDMLYGKCGIGDLMFYSVTACVSVRIFVQTFNHTIYQSLAGVASFTVVGVMVIGLYVTIFLLRKYRRPLPALPLPLTFALVTIAMILCVL